MMRLTRQKAKPSILLAFFLTVLGASSAVAGCSDPPGPGVNWVRCDLSHRQFSAQDLTGAVIEATRFVRADLSDSDFSNTKARNAKFVSTNLLRANFTGADARESDFTKAELQNANFEGTDLRRTRFFRANLRGANLTAARIEDADFYLADLSGVIWLDGKRVCAEGSISFCK
ncbi:MAG: pentapeptide repeat-containing protein [Pseudomonadota bacterium]